MVCLGNICRSPLAEGILKSKLNPDYFIVDSAGTAAYHIGELPDYRSIAIAKKNGIDISNQRARKFIANDFNEFDLIYAMDSENYKNIYFIDVDDSKSLDLFKNYIKEASMKIVTPDSVNMVYECLSSRGETILLNMPSKKNNKIVMNINALKKDKRVGYMSISNLSEGITTHKLEKQNKYFDVLREVEKLSYSILNSIN